MTHAGVVLARTLGSSVAADGFSAPYRIAMAFATRLYGFVGLLLSFRLARKYIEERWALLATIAVWWASSLPFYMYFNPAWSHANSAFAVALFLWHWLETRSSRSLSQWLILALTGGLMVNVYYPNAMVLAVPGVEAVRQYTLALHRSTPTAPEGPLASELLARHVLFVPVVLVCLLPTFVTRYIVYGSPFESGYVSLRDWLWRSPVFLGVLFSSNHGLFLGTIGLFIFWRREPGVCTPFVAAFLAF